MKRSSEVGLKLLSTVASRAGFLISGITTACFKLAGICPFVMVPFCNSLTYTVNNTKYCDVYNLNYNLCQLSITEVKKITIKGNSWGWWNTFYLRDFSMIIEKKKWNLHHTKVSSEVSEESWSLFQGSGLEHKNIRLKVKDKCCLSVILCFQILVFHDAFTFSSVCLVILYFYFVVFSLLSFLPRHCVAKYLNYCIYIILFKIYRTYSK